MIKLGSKVYNLQGVQSELFWKHLDNITVGQKLNPEFGYTTPHYGKFDNVFGGRKDGNTFTVFLYRPVTQGVRTEILCKGTLMEDKDGLKLSCDFEYPFWSFVMLLAFSLMLFALYTVAPYLAAISIVIGTLGYIGLVTYNYSNIKSEIANQLRALKRKSSTDS